jgi:hypothetical protein
MVRVSYFFLAEFSNSHRLDSLRGKKPFLDGLPSSTTSHGLVTAGVQDTSINVLGSISGQSSTEKPGKVSWHLFFANLCPHALLLLHASLKKKKNGLFHHYYISWEKVT